MRGELFFKAEQIVRRNVEPLAEINDFFIVELDLARFIFAVIGLIFVEFFGDLRLRYAHRPSRFL